MAVIAFDTLAYARKLEEAGFTRRQAEIQAETMREQAEAQNVLLQKTLDKYDEASRKDLATKGDIQDVRGEIQDVRGEILRLENKIEATKHEILKWVIGTMVAQTALIVAVIGVAIALVVK